MLAAGPRKLRFDVAARLTLLRHAPAGCRGRSPILLRRVAGHARRNVPGQAGQLTSPHSPWRFLPPPRRPTASSRSWVNWIQARSTSRAGRGPWARHRRRCSCAGPRWRPRSSVRPPCRATISVVWARGFCALFDADALSHDAMRMLGPGQDRPAGSRCPFMTRCAGSRRSKFHYIAVAGALKGGKDALDRLEKVVASTARTR